MLNNIENNIERQQSCSKVYENLIDNFQLKIIDRKYLARQLYQYKVLTTKNNMMNKIIPRLIKSRIIKTRKINSRPIKTRKI